LVVDHHDRHVNVRRQFGLEQAHSGIPRKAAAILIQSLEDQRQQANLPQRIELAPCARGSNSLAPFHQTEGLDRALLAIVKNLEVLRLKIVDEAALLVAHHDVQKYLFAGGLVSGRLRRSWS